MITMHDYQWGWRHDLPRKINIILLIKEEYDIMYDLSGRKAITDLSGRNMIWLIKEEYDIICIIKDDDVPRMFTINDLSSSRTMSVFTVNKTEIIIALHFDKIGY